MKQLFDLPHELRHCLDLSVTRLPQFLEVQAVHNLDQFTAFLAPADHHFHKRSEPGIRRARPFAYQSVLILQRLHVDAGKREEGNSFRTARPLVAIYLVEMAGGAGLLERRHGHDVLIIPAVVAC